MIDGMFDALPPVIRDAGLWFFGLMSAVVGTLAGAWVRAVNKVTYTEVPLVKQELEHLNEKADRVEVKLDAVLVRVSPRGGSVHTTGGEEEGGGYI